MVAGNKRTKQSVTGLTAATTEFVVDNDNQAEKKT